MDLALSLLAAAPAGPTSYAPYIAAVVIVAVFGIVFAILLALYGGIWFQAYMSDANVSLWSLVGMSLRRVNSRVIVQAKIMAMQAGIGPERETGVTTRRLEALYLAGGNVPNVIRALIAAHRADIDLDFDRASAIDLAGRDVLEAVQTSVNPRVIDCPDTRRSQRSTLSAIAKNGVELKVRARVTVRTNIEQLIGGATEETIIARVGEGIITAIGSAETHFEVMENPDKISRAGCMWSRHAPANSRPPALQRPLADQSARKRSQGTVAFFAAPRASPSVVSISASAARNGAVPLGPSGP
jgi:uncharacterized protein YqfA (UPF0365 family)